ncbi:MAG: hypothetical protein Q7O66_21330, partial [Dehalococcoidia bacterium]|nr:hypothetical protein [Dehalococcoidia bacterium]
CTPSFDTVDTVVGLWDHLFDEIHLATPAGGRWGTVKRLEDIRTSSEARWQTPIGSNSALICREDELRRIIGASTLTAEGHPNSHA